jgi:acyl-CoA synthetase (AMP-forming)/AMP-acid ligase II
MMEPCLANFALHIRYRAEKFPDGTAYIFPRGSISYGDLERESSLLARGLLRSGIGKGVRVAFMVPPAREFFILAFALLKLGAIPILIDPGIGLRQIRRCLEAAGPAVFIGIPRAHLGRLLFGWGKRTIRLQVTVGKTRIWSGTSFDALRAAGQGAQPMEAIAMDPDEPAAVVFTSGSTGPSKGAIYTHRMLNAQVELLQKHHGIAEREVSLATFPLFALFDPAMGVTSVIPEMDFTRPGKVNPENIIRPVREHSVTHMFGSPALLKRVASKGDFAQGNLDSLKRVLSAGAPISPKILRSFLARLPQDAKIFTPYGATEALPVATISHEAILDGTELMTFRGSGICVGRPFPELFVGIIRIDDEPIGPWSEELLLPMNEIGEIVVAGANVSPAYDRNPGANRLSKIEGADGAIYHRTGDLGYLDPDRRLWYCGRKSHRITTLGGVLFPVACEGIFNRHPAVYRSALVGVGPACAKTPVLCVELEPAARAANQTRLREELLQIGAESPITQTIRTILFHPSFPVDIRHNAKIFREQLALWAERKMR